LFFTLAKVANCQELEKRFQLTLFGLNNKTVIPYYNWYDIFKQLIFISKAIDFLTDISDSYHKKIVAKNLLL
jgi:hypothetical protein